MMRRKRTTSKPLEVLPNAKRAFVTLTGWEAGLVPLQEVRKVMLSLGIELDRARLRIAELEPLAEIGRRVSGSRSTKSQLREYVEKYWSVYNCARDLVEAGIPRRGLASKVDKRLGRQSPGIRQINRVLEWCERIRPEEFTPPKE